MGQVDVGDASTTEKDTLSHQWEHRAVEAAEGGHVDKAYADMLQAQLLEQQSIEKRKRVKEQSEGAMTLSEQMESQLGEMVWGANEGAAPHGSGTPGAEGTGGERAEAKMLMREGAEEGRCVGECLEACELECKEVAGQMGRQSCRRGCPVKCKV